MAQDDISRKKSKNNVAASDGSLLLAAENLKKGMTFTMNQLNSRKVPSEKKLRWLKALTRQAEAIVDVVEALNKIGSKSASDIDLATFLSSIEERLPIPPPSSSRRGPEPRRMIKALSQFREVARMATDDEEDEEETEEIQYGRGFRTTRRF